MPKKESNNDIAVEVKRIFSASHGKYAIYRDGKFAGWEKR